MEACKKNNVVNCVRILVFCSFALENSINERVGWASEWEEEREDGMP